MNKNDKISFVSFLIAAICFYALSVMNFANKDTSTAVVFLCVGSALFCTSTTYLNKGKKDK